MTSVRTTCTFCGDVDLRPDELVVNLHHDGTHTYEFDCPICETPMEREANERIVAALLAVGVDIIAAPAVPGIVKDAITDSLSRLRRSAVDLNFMSEIETPADMGFVS